MNNSPQKGMFIRLAMILVIVTLCLVVAVPAILAYRQIYMYDFYTDKAVSQQTKDIIIAASRGTIYDTNLKPLAVSADVEQINVDPSLISEENRAFVAQNLADILELDYETVLAKLEKNTSYEIIKREVEVEISAKVRAFALENSIRGIIISPDTKRYYPQGSLASNLLGFTGIDGTGLEGIEAYYDDLLSGTPGRIISARDAAGQEVGFGYDELIDPQDGSSLVLTIDEVIQYYLEKHLAVAEEDNQPLEGVSGIVMDIKTGEILAIANTPTYDSNNYSTIIDASLLEELQLAIDEGATEEEYNSLYTSLLFKMWRNKSVVDSFEPGSIFKLFTSAVALEEGLIDENETFYCSGSITVAGIQISCHDTAGHGVQTLTQVLENSCNPGIMQVGFQIGATKFLEYFEAFGFTEKTGVDFYGETSGVFHDYANFNEVELATSSFGQTFQITPLQLITAVSAIVNDGYMVTPHLVKQVIDSDGKIVSTTDTTPIKQVISTETSAFMREALSSVVSVGGGRNAYVEGYRVGGKSSTSEKVSKNLESEENYYISSFVGVAPMDDPQIAVLVMIDEPTGSSHYGGTIAAPVVARILSDILPYIGVEPEYTAEELASIDVTTPNLVGLTETEVYDRLSTQNLEYRVVGEGDTVTDQVPSPGTKVPSSATMIIYMGESKPTESVTVPDVSGMSVSQAKAMLEEQGLFLKTTGISALISNTVQTKAGVQSPDAGADVTIGTIVTVQFTDTSNIYD